MALRAFVNKILIIIIRKEKKNRIRKKSTVNRNIKNTVSNLISICPLERNISVLENTDVPYIYIYIYIYICVCVCVCMFLYIYIYQTHILISMNLKIINP